MYKRQQYEILSRNLLGNNADAAELYGMPSRIGTTTKTDESERGAFEAALRDMGSTGYILKDAMDEVELLESKGNGQGFKIYPDLELRLEKKISKIILGHADAIDSTPGKLGGGNGDESPAAQALRDKQIADGVFIEDVINTTLIPKLVNMGFPIDVNYRFAFSNNAEMVDQRKNEDANNKVTADIAYTLKQAGMDIDPAYIQERTGIPVTKSEPVAPLVPKPAFNPSVKNKLDRLYGK